MPRRLQYQSLYDLGDGSHETFTEPCFRVRIKVVVPAYRTARHNRGLPSDALRDLSAVKPTWRLHQGFSLTPAGVDPDLSL